jgi:hypothetical protein
MATGTEAYRRENRWGGWVLAAVFLVPLIPAEAGVVMSGVPGVITGSIPFLLLALYVLAVVAVNRTVVEVTREGIRLYYKPLPTGERPLWVPREDVTKVYVRKVEIQGRTTIRYKLAGVETKAGWRVDLSDAAEPEKAAEEIAKALGWKGTVEQLEGRAPRGRGVALRMTLRVAGLLALAIAWVMWG